MYDSISGLVIVISPNELNEHLLTDCWLERVEKEDENKNGMSQRRELVRHWKYKETAKMPSKFHGLLLLIESMHQSIAYCVR